MQIAENRHRKDYSRGFVIPVKAYLLTMLKILLPLKEMKREIQA